MKIRLPMKISTAERKVMDRRYWEMLLTYLCLVLACSEMNPSSSEDPRDLEPSVEVLTFS